MAYRVGGKTIRESARTTVKKDANELLLERVRASNAGTLSGAPLTVAGLCLLVEEDHKTNGRRTHTVALRNYFGKVAQFLGAKTKARDVTVDAIERYKAARLSEKAAPGTLALELAWLKRSLRLARRRGLLAVVPDFTSVTVDNARRVFFDPEQFEAVRSRLPGPAADLVEALWWLGWRSKEVAGLEWSCVDETNRTIRLDTSKSGAARIFPYGPVPGLLALVARRVAVRDALRASGVISPWVFCREDGRPVGSFRRPWATACLGAGQPSKTVHDLRRSAARRMVRQGVPQHVVMALCGWQTAAMFRRYAITDFALLEEALARANR
jgi:integrase